MFVSQLLSQLHAHGLCVIVIFNALKDNIALRLSDYCLLGLIGQFYGDESCMQDAAWHAETDTGSALIWLERQNQ